MSGNLGILWHMLRGQPRRGEHAQRLQAFYAPQAAGYDAFRERLLHGRRELAQRLLDSLEQPTGATLVELGAGTGRNLEFLGPRLNDFARVELVDLCPALLEVARQRARAHANVTVIEADATRHRPAATVDAVMFSYSLTMIPDWEGALANAVDMLKPGGVLGVVDFTLSASQSPLARGFWRKWFGHDGVHLSMRHSTELARRLPDHSLEERRAPLPYLAGLSVPYYLFVGRKPG